MIEGSVRLLIVEDEDTIRNSIYKYIGKHTTVIDEIYQAANGQEAIDLIIQYRPHIMLLDIQMPLKDGLTVMKEAAAAGVCPRTVILSGYNEFTYAQQALRYGAVDYLLKPCRSTEILEIVENIAKGEISKPAAEPPPEPPADGKSPQSNQFVNEAIEFMRDHYPEDITLSAVAEKIGITPSYLSTLFTRTLGAGFAECLNKIRIQRACDYFYDKRMKTYEIAFKVGFNDEKYFSNVFKKMMGKSPSEYRKTMTEPPELI